MRSLLLAAMVLLASLQMGCSLIGATLGAATGGRQGARRGFELGAGIDGAVVAVAAATHRHRSRHLNDDHPQSSPLLFYRCQTAKQPAEPRYYQVEHGVEAFGACESFFGERCTCEES